MKTKQLLYAVLASLVLPACVADNDGGDSPKQNTNAKIQINIVTDKGVTSRAEEFENGSVDENEITSATIVFYDSRRTPMQKIPIDSSKIKNAGNKKSSNVAIVKTIEAEVNLKDGAYPSYMMVYANPVVSESLSFSLDEIGDAISDDYMSNGNFSMSNAVYFDKDGALVREIPVHRKNFYLKSDKKPTVEPVTVYLERMAAKVTLKTTDGNNKYQEGDLDGKHLKFTVTSWGLNAVAKNCYFSKCFLDANNSRLSKSRLDASLSTFKWNDTDNYRSYWAISPFYYLNSSNIDSKGETANSLYFPWVSDQVSNSNILSYYSFKEIEKRTGNKGAEVGGSLYSMENTVEALAYNTADINNNAALVSAIVTGNYTLDGNTVDFYVHADHIYTEENYLKAMYELCPVIVKDDGSKLSETELSTVFDIYHPKEPVWNDKSKGIEENKVTIKFKATEDNLQKYKYKKGTANPVDIKTDTEDIVNEINKELQAHCGLASKYYEGKAYFVVPIRHLAEKADDAESWPAGSFGLVRNHSYVISVDGFANLSFESLGIGVGDPEKPIVPPSDPNLTFGIKANVNVLSWRLVNQNVTLGQK